MAIGTPGTVVLGKVFAIYDGSDLVNLLGVGLAWDLLSGVICVVAAVTAWKAATPAHGSQI